MADYFTVLTTLGKAKLADAIANGQPLVLTHMAFGDGVGGPAEGQTALIAEKHRRPLNSIRVVPNNPAWVEVEAVIPQDVGGWYVREVGVYDGAGALIAVGRYPDSFKPQLDSGTGKDLYIRMILEVGNTSAVTLKIDPSIVLATRKYVDETMDAHKASHDHPYATVETPGFTKYATVPECLEGERSDVAVTPEGLGGALAALNMSGRLLRVVSFMTAGTFTYTRSPDAKSGYVIVKGAGGPGGGAIALANGGAAGGGGGEGGKAEKYFAALPATASVVVGLGGVRGAATNGGTVTGTPGGTSSFAGVSATGGASGQNGYTNSGTAGGLGGLGGLGSGGDLNWKGQDGGSGSGSPTSGNGSVGGSGGGECGGRGGNGGAGTGAAGTSGAGGGGASTNAVGTANLASNGGDGYVIIFEMS